MTLMSSVLNQKWEKIDNNEEETILNGVKFIRPIGDQPLPLDCSFCKKLISTVEDVECLKKSNLCEICYDLYYYHNKEKWNNGWRPNK